MASKRHNLGGRFACIQSLSWSSRWVQPTLVTTFGDSSWRHHAMRHQSRNPFNGTKSIRLDQKRNQSGASLGLGHCHHHGQHRVVSSSIQSGNCRSHPKSFSRVRRHPRKGGRLLRSTAFGDHSDLGFGKGLLGSKGFRLDSQSDGGSDRCLLLWGGREDDPYRRIELGGDSTGIRSRPFHAFPTCASIRTVSDSNG